MKIIMTATEMIQKCSLTSEQYRRKYQAYREASAPIVKMQAQLANTQLSKMMLLPNGEMRIEHSEEYKALRKEITKILEDVYKQIFEMEAT